MIILHPDSESQMTSFGESKNFTYKIKKKWDIPNEKDMVQMTHLFTIDFGKHWESCDEQWFP